MNSLSIIVPIYNAERFLARCLLSIVEQDIHPFEVILVNDGSTDSSENICLDFVRRYSFIKFFAQQNCGVSSARNLGVQHARGEFVAFVDADDILPDHALSTMIAVGSDHPADMHVFNTAKISGIPSNVPLSTSSLPFDGVYVEPTEVMSLLLRYAVPVGPVAKLYNRTFFDRVCFTPGMKVGEDLLFNLHYLGEVRAPIFFADVVVYHCIDNKQSAMHMIDVQKCYDQLNAAVGEWLHQRTQYEALKDDLDYFQTVNILQIIFRAGVVPSVENGYLPFLRSLPDSVIAGFSPKWQARIHRFRSPSLNFWKLYLLAAAFKRRIARYRSR